MKGNPAVPGGSLTSKPTWSNTFTVFHRVGFFFAFAGAGRSRPPGMKPMDKSNSTMAHQLALAAWDFEQQRTGHAPESVTAVLSDGTLVITLRGMLAPVEKDLAKGLAGAAQVKEFHRQLFIHCCGMLRRKIEKITGVDVREATSDVVTETGTEVQVFLLAGSVPADTWKGCGPGDRS